MDNLKKLDSPLERIEWRDPNTLHANSYNPNVVMTKEMNLLAFSIETSGWIQPILITTDGEIIDGFHRHCIAKAKNWLVPCCIMEMDATDRKLLTVRINRAKGSHVACRMSDLVREMLEAGVTKERIAKGIGADMDEVDLLAKDDIFKAFDFNSYAYSRSWTPAKKSKKK